LSRSSGRQEELQPTTPKAQPEDVPEEEVQEPEAGAETILDNPQQSPSLKASPSLQPEEELPEVEPEEGLPEEEAEHQEAEVAEVELEATCPTSTATTAMDGDTTPQTVPQSQLPT
jgi:hypothetical protein